MFSCCLFKLCCILIMIALVSNGAYSQDDRFVELVNVCTGQDLLHVISRACSMHKKRNSLSLTEHSYPRSIPIQDVAKVCCKIPCRISLFLRLCFPTEE